jgi:hypothetical protein
MQMYMRNQQHVQWIKFKNFIIFWAGEGGGAQFSSLPQVQKILLSVLLVVVFMYL